MKKFILNVLRFGIPLLLSVYLYLIIDPFKVIYKYSEQINTENKYQITGNRDFQSTQLLLWNYKKYNYDSFILGNSRSMFYQVNTWSKYIKGNPFHFNASSESLFGIEGKLKLLDELNVDIKNVILVLDFETLMQVKNSEGHLFIKHPAVSNESAFAFHYEMFKGFFPKAMFALTDLYVTGKKKKYMEGFGVINNIWKHDMKSNQLSYYVYDQLIKINPNLYYKDKKNLFYNRNPVQEYSQPIINKEQAALLQNITSILKSHHTRYKIIINPLYDQIKLNPQDLNYVKSLFGEENVFDFSGINIFTNDYHNYYETSHYRPFVCDYILNIIYQGKEIKNIP